MKNAKLLEIVISFLNTQKLTKASLEQSKNWSPTMGSTPHQNYLRDPKMPKNAKKENLKMENTLPLDLGQSSLQFKETEDGRLVRYSNGLISG